MAALPETANVNNAINILTLATQIDALGRSLATSKTFLFSVQPPYLIQSDKIRIKGNAELAAIIGKAIGDSLAKTYIDLVAKANALTNATVPTPAPATAQQVST